jgi:hypothetical protein
MSGGRTRSVKGTELLDEMHAERDNERTAEGRSGRVILLAVEEVEGVGTDLTGCSVSRTMEREEEGELHLPSHQR